MPKISIIGATGAVGRRMLAELEAFGIEGDIQLLASERSSGQTLMHRGRELRVAAFKEVNQIELGSFVLMSAGGEFSRQFAKSIAHERRAVVIDNSSAWRMDEDVPLVVPEVNAEVLRSFQYGVIANPNCSTIQLVVALKPLLDNYGLRSVTVSTYQSVSGSGQKGIEELQRQQQQSAKGETPTKQKYPRTILHNLIPAIDVFREGGHCYEEEKMVRETRKILSQPRLAFFATTVRVPVFYCHSEAVTVELEHSASREELWNTLEAAPGIKLSRSDRYEDLFDPLELNGSREVFVCRVRLPLGESRSTVVQFWNVADNLNKGAASNAVQILKKLM